MKKLYLVIIYLTLALPVAAKSLYSNYPTDYPALISLECSFIADLQVTTPGSDLGGMREGEQLWDVIQTDNTTESIWVWSYFHDTTGSTIYNTNVANAWTYIQNHPGWLEEGGSDPVTGYYRVYVSGWGPIAEMGYEDSYSDASHRSYGDSCANYIANNPLNLTQANCRVINNMVEAWAIGGLYQYAVRYGNAGWKTAALNMASQIKANVEANPSMYLSNSSWALSGGAVMWGLLHSYFLEHPGEALVWVNTYAPYLSDYEPVQTWNNAHNNWYALAHISVFSINSNPAEYESFRFLRLRLMGQDTDHDGGIPSQENHASDADESWVSNYQVYMTFVPGTEFEVGVTISNFQAVNSLEGVCLHWSCSSLPSSGFDILRKNSDGTWKSINKSPINGSSPFVYVDAEVKPGSHYCYTLLADDKPVAQTEILVNPTNPGLTIKPIKNPAQSTLNLRISQASNSPATLSIYDIAGRLVYSSDLGYLAEGENSLQLNLARNNVCSSGIYYIKLKQNQTIATTAFIAEP